MQQSTSRIGIVLHPVSQPWGRAMRNMRPLHGRRLLAVAGLLLAPTVSGCTSPEAVAVGVAMSSPFVDAARMALDDAIVEDGPLPVRLDTILIPEGTNQAAPALRAAETLVAAEGIAGVVGHANSAASLAAAPIYNAHEVVQIAPSSTADIYSRAGAYSFRLVPSDERQGAFLAEQVSRLLPAGGSLAVFYVNDDYGRGLRRAFINNLAPAVDVSLDLPHTETEVLPADLSRVQAHLAEADVDAVAWLGRGTVLDRYLPALREAVPDAPLIGGDAVSSIRQSAGDEGLRQGIRYVGLVDLEATDALRSFVTAYGDRFDRSPTGADALTYDAIRLLIDAIRAGARDGPAIRDHLHALGRDRDPWPGLTGPVAFDERGDVDRSYVMITHEPGRAP